MTVPRILQFLLQIHTWICTSSQTVDRVDRKESMEVVGGREEHL